jgi:REP element-mobilizing transposase RayT
MARARKRHIQLDMLTKHGERPRGRRGGKRRNAGRKPKGARAGSPHTKRPELKARHPVHVVLRVVDAMGNLRKRHFYKALREATIAVALRELHVLESGAFRIVHISIQRNHVHLLVEADHKRALSRGMQAFQISAAKHLNRALSLKSISLGKSKAAMRALMQNRRRGTVFPDRFHQEIITTPTQARRALAYVLNNWRKHREDRAEAARTWKVDPYSTGVLFDGWKERADADVYMPYRETYRPMVVYLPRTWLLREGWRKVGLVAFEYVPSTKQVGLQRAPVE